MEPLLPPVSALQVETFYFSPAVKAPGTDKTLFLGGAGARGLEIQGKFIKFTAIGVYLAPESIPFLAERWKGKAAEELAGCVEFFRDVITGPFEKFTRVTMILPLTGLQYSEKVAENCVAIWKSVGIYTNAEAMAVDKFKQIFKDENFPPGASILFTQSPSGSLTISFSKDSSIPAVSNGGIIENKAMSEAVLASIIGPNGVSPEAKVSLSGRMADLLSEYKVELHLPPVSALHVEAFNFPPAMKAPGTEKTMFLGGAGARGLEIQGKFVKFTAIGVYLAPEALPFLARRWKGKAAEELAGSVEFFRDVITGPFEKFTRVTMILPLTGLQYSEKVAENCVAIWKSVGIYTNAEAMAVDKFKQIFKDENFPPGASILFTQSPSGSLTISFSKDSSIPAVSNGGIIENKALSEAVLSSIIGPNGVSPELKVSLAGRVADLLSEYKG